MPTSRARLSINSFNALVPGSGSATLRACPVRTRPYIETITASARVALSIAFVTSASEERSSSTIVSVFKPPRAKAAVNGCAMNVRSSPLVIARLKMRDAELILSGKSFASLRTSVIVFAVRSMLPTLNGPAVVSGFPFQPSLKTDGLPFVEAG